MLCVGCSRAEPPNAESIQQCRALGGGSLAAAGVEVRIESRLEPGGRIRGGRTPSCSVDRGATEAFLGVVRALDGIAPRFLPDAVTVHVDPALPGGEPRLGPVEFHRSSGSLLVSSRELSRVNRSVWLHEIGHLMAAGRRPRGPIGGAVIGALDEGVADYYAAVLGRSPVLGVGDGARDLSGPVRGKGPWQLLAVDPRRFDRHDMGRRFAARMYARAATPGALLADVLECSRRTRPPSSTDTVRAVLGAWVAACPERSRAVIDSVVRTWIPGQLY